MKRPLACYWVCCCVCVLLGLLVAGHSHAQDTRPTPALPLTEAEKAWIAAHPVVRIQMSDSSPPFEYRDGGTWKGMAHDYLRESCRRAGLRVEETGIPWSVAVESIQSSKPDVDLLLAVTQSPLREQQMRLTQPYLKFPQMIFAARDHDFISGQSDLAGKTIVVEKDYVMEELLKRDLPTAKLLVVNSTPDALMAVSSRRADAYIGNLAVASYIIETEGLVNVEVAAPSAYGDEEFCMGIRKDWPELQAILNKALNSFSQQDHQSIRQKWLSVRFNYGLSAADILKWVLVVAVIALIFIGQSRQALKRRTLELKREVELRRAKEDHLSEAQRIANMGSWNRDYTTNVLTWSEETRRIFGWPAGKPITFAEFLRLVHPEDAGNLSEKQTAALNGLRPISCEYRVIRPDGEIRHIQERCKAEHDAAGKLVKLEGTVLDITDRVRSELALRESEKRFKSLFDAAADALFLHDMKGHFVDVNRAACESLGYTREELLTMAVKDIEKAFDAEKQISTLENLQNDKGVTIEGIHCRKDGSLFPVEVRLIRFPHGERTLVFASARNISERKKAEQEKAQLQEQLQQSAKMEAVGRLAGGIAHDFNNLLTVIGGNVELTSYLLPPAHPAAPFIEGVSAASQRAATLTRQLLTFSRRQIVEPRVLNVNELIGNMAPMLARLISEAIQIESALEPKLDLVKIDPGQFEQVLMNLAVNARDAMPRGGTLRFETKNVEVSAEHCAGYPHMTAGTFVCVAVSDTGVGMNAEVRKHIFEPFFTTKGVGKGTGLGLAMTFGFVEQAGGCIRVETEENKGTRFEIFLPTTKEQPLPAAVEAPPPSEPHHETILVVEDDSAVRQIARKILEQLGYRVLIVENPADSLQLAMDHVGPIHLLMTDVVMPGLNGRELAERIQKIRPEIKVLYTSGYTEDVIVHHDVIDKQLQFIAKPYTSQQLSQKIRSIL